MAGPRVWGGKQEKTPSRFSSNPCLWSVASSLSASPLSLSVWVSPFLYLFLSLILSPCLSSSYLSHLISLLVSLCLHVSVSLFVSPQALPFFRLLLSLPAPLSVRLSLSWSICPSLSVCLCVGVSVHLFHHPSVWLSVLVLLRVPTRFPRYPPPGQQRPLLAQGWGGDAELQLLEASVAAGLSWEFGASQLQKQPLLWAPRPRTPEQKGERKRGLTAAECMYVYVRGEAEGLTLPSLHQPLYQIGARQERDPQCPPFLSSSQWQRCWDPGRRGWGGARSWEKEGHSFLSAGWEGGPSLLSSRQSLGMVLVLVSALGMQGCTGNSHWLPQGLFPPPSFSRAFDP